MDDKRATSSSVGSALEEQQLLLENSLALVFAAYDAAKRKRMRDPVVLLLDCEDAIGGEIARGWLGEDAVAEAIQARRSSGASPDETTVFAHAFPWTQCRTEVPAVFSYLAPVFEQSPAQDGFLAIAVTAGGASALTVPFAAREPLQ